jgi:hypothetical protein
MIDYLEQSRTINGTYYANEFRRLRQEKACKRRGKLTQEVLLLHDNTQAHTSQVAMSAATDFGFEIIHHPPHSPNLTPSDYCLFPKQSNESVIEAINEFIKDQNREFCFEGLNKLEHSWARCIDVEGGYIEKLDH